MISDTENAFEKFKKTISTDDQYPTVLQELKELRQLINNFKEKENDMSLDVNVIKKSTDALQNKAFKLFERVTKKQQNHKTVEGNVKE